MREAALVPPTPTMPKKPKKNTREPSAEPTVRKRRDPVPQPHGGALVPGAGGGPQPGSGRPPDQWKASLRALADRAEVLKHLDEALKKGPDDPFFEKALDYATDHGYGRATQPVQHDASGSLADLLTKLASGGE